MTKAEDLQSLICLEGLLPARDVPTTDFWCPISTRLAAYLEVKSVHNGLDYLGRARMLFGMVEHDCQHKGTCMLLDRHPSICEQYPGTSFDLDHVMVIAHQLRSLFRRANSNCLVGMNLIERFGHVT